MPRHSKNATARQYFSYGEKRKLTYGTRTSRLGADSQKRPEQCTLCLELAIDAQACSDGHVFCKACIYENLLYQKQAIKTAEAKYGDDVRQRQTDLQQDGVRSEDQRIAKFALMESGITPDNAVSSSSSKANLRAFWLPDCTLSCEPDYQTEKELAPPNTKTQCPEGHPLKLSQLKPVRFTDRIDLDDAASETDRNHRFMCPCCRKALTAAVRSVWLSSCGHVVCKNCFETLVRPEKSCAHCGKRLKQHVEWGATGFAGSLNAKLKAQVVTPAFQG